MKIEIGKKTIFTPSPYMSGQTVYVPEPISGTITKIFRDPFHRIIGIEVTDKKGNTYKAYPHQLVTRIPAVYNFI